VSHLLNTKRHAQAVAGERIRQAGKDQEARNAALREAKELKSEISQLEHDLALVDDELFSLALAVPNDTHPLTPLGPESAAVILSTHGPEPIPASPLRDHVSVCRDLGLLDLEAGATVTGSSWYYLLHEAALLEMALTNYGLSIALQHGFTPVTTPDVVRSDVAHRCGFQPRDTNADPPVSQMYHSVGRFVLVLASRTRVVRNGRDTACGHVREPDLALETSRGKWLVSGVRSAPKLEPVAQKRGLIPRAPIHEARAVRRIPGQSERRS
jgi:seryl-tRNA synthetase